MAIHAACTLPLLPSKRSLLATCPGTLPVPPVSEARRGVRTLEQKRCVSPVYATVGPPRPSLRLHNENDKNGRRAWTVTVGVEEEVVDLSGRYEDGMRHACGRQLEIRKRMGDIVCACVRVETREAKTNETEDGKGMRLLRKSRPDLRNNIGAHCQLYRRIEEEKEKVARLARHRQLRERSRFAPFPFPCSCLQTPFLVFAW